MPLARASLMLDTSWPKTPYLAVQMRSRSLREHTHELQARRPPPSANVVDAVPLPATAAPVAFSSVASPVDDWALALGFEPEPRPARGVTATFAHLVATRNGELADLEQKLNTNAALTHTVDAAGSIPAHLNHLSGAQHSLMLSELCDLEFSDVTPDELTALASSTRSTHALSVSLCHFISRRAR